MKPERVNRSTQQDRARFERTALPLLDAVYNTAWRLTRNVDEASDLAQETYLRAYRTFGGFTPGTNCKAWLFTILYSIVSNRRRQQRRRPDMLSLDEWESRHGGEPQAEDQEPVVQLTESVLEGADPEIDRALRQLPLEFQATVLMVDVEELTYEEAARALGCPVGTVRSRLFRARRILFRALQAYAGKLGYSKR